MKTKKTKQCFECIHFNCDLPCTECFEKCNFRKREEKKESGRSGLTPVEGSIPLSSSPSPEQKYENKLTPAKFNFIWGYNKALEDVVQRFAKKGFFSPSSNLIKEIKQLKK